MNRPMTEEEQGIAMKALAKREGHKPGFPKSPNSSGFASGALGFVQDVINSVGDEWEDSETVQARFPHIKIATVQSYLRTGRDRGALECRSKHGHYSLYRKAQFDD